jgi:uroporphyrinogen-III synthase
MRVIVTRPEQEGQGWVERLRARGVEALALPLMVIDAASDTAPLRDAWQRLGSFRAVMFVSGNAVRGFFAQRPGSRAFDLRAWAPGPGTAEALVQAGVDAALIDGPAIDAAQFDSEALWRRVATQVRRGDTVLIVRGGDAQGRPAGREWLGEQLAQAGARSEAVVAYVRRAPDWSAAQRALATGAAADDSVWLFSSSEALGHLRMLLPAQDWRNARALATHPRIAQAARDAGFGHVGLCRPAFEEVLASLQSAR